MKKKSAEDYLDRLLNSVNDQKVRKEKFKETAKILEDAMTFWETDEEGLEDAEYMQVETKEEKHSEQEDFLDALLSGAKDTEFGMNRRKPDTNPMYSRRVSKSEAEFLREFEEELAEEDEDLEDLFAEFEHTEESEEKRETTVTGFASESMDTEAGFDEIAFDEIPLDDSLPEESMAEEIMPEESMPEENMQDDGFTLGDVDLAALIDEATGVMSAPQEASSFSEEESLLPEEEPVMAAPFDMQEPIPMDEIPEDVFADLFGGDEEVDLSSMEQETESDSEGLDLGNLGDEDLMSLLAGADDLADIGSMLSQSEATEIPLEELEAFDVFADGEMAAQQISADPAVEEEIQPEKKKKGGLLGKLKGMLGGLMKDDEEVELKPGAAPTATELSDENDAILAELDQAEEKTAKKEKKKKEKKKKEKKPKAPKKPKPPKPKKEKKPKEVDNTPPLPKGPVLMIWFMVGSLMVLVLLGVNLIKYNTPLAEAKALQNEGHYAEAFSKLNGLEMKEKDLEFYSQLAVLATVDSEINAYEVFANAEVHDKAYDSLICAAGRCHINAEEADVFGCLGQLEIMKKMVSNELEQKYNTTYDEAIEMYSIRHRDDYTLALYKKLTELGIEWD